MPELEVGTSVMPAPGRHPLLVAGQTQTAQALADRLPLPPPLL
ncbi:hypothetical protein [Nocardia farcinica]|nr:hypothetical protein [Nocardia farcinica]